MTTKRERMEHEGGDLVNRAENALENAASWAADRLGRREPAGAEPDPPSVPRRTPAPVQGDAGARAAGSVEDDITDERPDV